MIQIEEELELRPADRYARAIAALIDLLIMVLITIPIAMLFGIAAMAQEGTQSTLFIRIFVTIVSFLVYAGVNWMLLKKNGQTIGKKMLNIRIVDYEGNKPSMLTLLFRRLLPFLAMPQLPLGMFAMILSFANVGWIFTPGSQCLHDLIAGTKVVND